MEQDGHGLIALGNRFRHRAVEAGELRTFQIQVLIMPGRMRRLFQPKRILGNVKPSGPGFVELPFELRGLSCLEAATLVSAGGSRNFLQKTRNGHSVAPLGGLFDFSFQGRRRM